MATDSADDDGCFRVVFNNYPPFSAMVRAKPIMFVGVMVQVMDIIAQKLGVCYRHYKPVDGAYGSLLPNGSWTGVIGMLHRKEAEVGGTVFAITYNRAKAIQYTHVITQSEHAIAFKTPIVEADIIGFIKPYSILPWIVILITCMVLVAAWMLFFRLKARIHQMKYEHNNTTTTTTSLPSPRGGKLEDLRQSFMMMYRVLMAQSLEVGSENKFSRHLLGVWLLCGMMIGVIYKSNLMAMLISPKITPPVKNLLDLVDNSKYSYLATKGSYLSQVVRISPPESVYGRMAGFLGSESNILKIVADVTSEKYMFLFIKNGFLGFFSLPNKGCPLSLAKETFLPILMAITMQKHWIYKEKVDRMLVGLTEAGIINHIEKVFTRVGQNCLRTKVDQLAALRALELKDFYGILLLFCGGMGLALVSFCIELCLGRHRRNTTTVGVTEPD